MIRQLQALATAWLAAAEARASLKAAEITRRAALTLAATCLGIGALLFVSIGLFFALSPGMGPAGAAIVMGVLWLMLAGAVYAVSLMRPRRLPPTAVPTAATTVPPVPPVPPPVPPGNPAARPARTMSAELRRAAPALAIGALVAGIITAWRR